VSASNAKVGQVRANGGILFTSFLATFIVARVIVFLIMRHDATDLYVRVGGTHIHHHVWGILLMAGLGLYLLLSDRRAIPHAVLAALYGLSLALTLDEFGMLVNLGGSYWQRASYDAVVIAATMLAIITAWPTLRARVGRSFRRVAFIGALASVGGVLYVQTYRLGGRLLDHVREIAEPTMASSDIAQNDDAWTK